MSYEEAMAGSVVSREEAALEVSRHGFKPQEFFEEVGDRSTYMSNEVLEWLGY